MKSPADAGLFFLACRRLPAQASSRERGRNGKAAVYASAVMPASSPSPSRPKRHCLKPMARLALALGICAVCVTAHSISVPAEWSRTCEARLPPVSVEVQAQPDDLVFRHERSIRELTAIQHPAGGRTFAVGLTEMKIETRIETQSALLTQQGQTVACSRPRFKVTLQLSPHVVWMAREFPQGSCAYRHIAEHEMRHVAVNRQTLHHTAKVLEDALKRSFGNRVLYGTRQELTEWLPAQLDKEWMPWVREQMQATLAQHREIDSPEEYARNEHVCGGEIARVLSRIN